MFVSGFCHSFVKSLSQDRTKVDVVDFSGSYRENGLRMNVHSGRIFGIFDPLCQPGRDVGGFWRNI